MAKFICHVIAVQALMLRLIAGKSALLLVDVQDCFLEANTTSGAVGSLEVPASHIIPVINSIREKDCLFDMVVRTQDYHPANHISFGSTHGLGGFAHLGGKGGLPLKCIKPTSGNTADASCCPAQFVNASAVDCSTQLCAPSVDWWNVNNSAFVTNNPACTQCKNNPENCFDDEQAMWPDHCLQSGDSTFPPSLTKKASDTIVQKGSNVYVDAYSAFMDNSRNLKTTLDSTLQNAGVDTLYIAGIATDVCVKWTVRDALGSETGNYTVNVISDASAGLAVGTTPTQLHDDALVWMSNAGATLMTSAQLLAMECPSTDTTSTVSQARASAMMGFAFIATLVLAFA